MKVASPIWAMNIHGGVCLANGKTILLLGFTTFSHCLFQSLTFFDWLWETKGSECEEYAIGF